MFFLKLWVYWDLRDVVVDVGNWGVLYFEYVISCWVEIVLRKSLCPSG